MAMIMRSVEMRRVMVISIIVLLLATTVLAAGRAFSGSYAVNGTNPGAGAYQGVLTITARGGVYDVVWTIGKAQYVGVGVVVNDTLAVSYTGAADRSWTGVAAYRQRADGSLDGRWAILGGSTTIGTETAVRR
jgi:hypothetical protein